MAKKRVLLVLSEGYEDLEAVAPVDVCNRVGIEVVIASLRPGVVKAAYGTNISPDTVLSEISGDFDAIVCPGGKKNAEALAADSTLRELIKDYHAKGKLVAAICAAPSHVLGESAQILAGKRATGDPGFNEKLAASGAELTFEPVSVEGNIITATGPGSALQFALTVAAYLVGKDSVVPFAEKWGVALPRGLS